MRQRLHAAEQGVEVDYRIEAVEALRRTRARHFAVVSSMEMIEHVPEPHAPVAGAHRAVAPGWHCSCRR
jgi:2-polyprenyl-6-hydroxyphenyl methylase/3-demethylubiquinone-9 3-methyltransferase